MATGYTFTRTGNTTKVVHITDDVVDKVDGFTGPVHVENINATSWQITAGSGVSLSFTTASIITIDGEAAAGTLSGLMDQLIAVFPDASSGGGEINYTAVADDTWDGFNTLEMSAPTTLTIGDSEDGALLLNKTGTDDLEVQLTGGDPAVIPTNDNGPSIISYTTKEAGEVWVEGADGSITILTDDAPASYDADSETYFTAQAVTDADEKGAVDGLVVGVKADSLWTPTKALHIFMGDTRVRNLKDTADTDAAFRLTQIGGSAAVLDASGVTTDGVDDALNTHLIPATDFGNNAETHVIAITAISGAGTRALMGVRDGTVQSHIYVDGGNIYFAVQTGGDVATGDAMTTPAILVITKRDNGGIYELRATLNGVEIYFSTTTSSTPVTTYKLYLGNWNNQNTPPGIPTACTIGLYWALNLGATNGQMTSLYTRASTFLNDAAINRI